MTLLLHAIAPHDAPCEPVPGLSSIDACGLTAWSTEWAAARRTLERDDLLRHHEIVASLHQRCGTVLPARFPTWLRDASAAHELLCERHADISAALERVRNRVELAVSVLVAEE